MDQVPRQFDVVLVGNGSISLFLAWQLIQHGQDRVAIVGPRGRHGGASAAAGAMLGCFGEVTADSPQTEAHKTKLAMSLAAHRRWPSVIEQLERHPASGHGIAVSKGTFVILNSCGSELDSRNFAAIARQLANSAEPWEETTATQIPGYRPRPQARAHRTLFLPNEWGINARKLLSTLDSLLSIHPQVTFVDSIAERTCFEDGTATAVALHDGQIIGGTSIVLAAGAFSGRLFPEAMSDAANPSGDMVQPTFAGIGVALTARRDGSDAGFEHVVRTPNRAFACGLHVVPQGDRCEYLGATNALLAEPQLQPFLGDSHFLAECGLQQLDERLFHHRILEWHTGNRPATLDGLPLAGWIAPGLYLLTGTYRDGLHAAPVLAEHAADQLAGNQGLFGGTFDPLRQPTTGRTIEESIEHYAAHRMAAWIESGSGLPPQTPAVAMEQTFTDQAARFYERMKISYGLGPDVLMHLMGALRSRSTIQVVRYLRARTVPAKSTGRQQEATVAGVTSTGAEKLR